LNAGNVAEDSHTVIPFWQSKGQLVTHYCPISSWTST